MGLGLIATVSFDLRKFELEEKKIMKADVEAERGEVYHLELGNRQERGHGNGALWGQC